MGEGDHTFRLRKAEGMWIGAVFVSVVLSPAVVAVSVCWAIPDGVSGVDLFAEATAMREWEGSLRATGRCVFIVILGHGEPPEVMLTSVFYGCGQSYAPSTHGFRPIMIQDESAVIKVRVNA